jgi:predicted nuclease of predicted toxin-antitoxin system
MKLLHTTKLLIDSCVSTSVATAFRAKGYEVDWVGDWGRDPGDQEILERAAQETRVLITLDRDFGELAVLRGMRHHGILRLVDIRLHEQAARAEEALRRYRTELEAGGIVTVEPTRIRIREAPP